MNIVGNLARLKSETITVGVFIEIGQLVGVFLIIWQICASFIQLNGPALGVPPWVFSLNAWPRPMAILVIVAAVWGAIAMFCDTVIYIPQF